jgi:hypothetical protein
VYNGGMDDFRQKVQKFLGYGESVQIVAPHGFGKSRFGRSLGGLYLDTNLLQTPQELIEAVKTSAERKLIVIDSLDRILSSEYCAFFSYLKALRDTHKYQLAYIFLTSKAVTHEALPIMGDLYELATEHVEYLPTLTRAEYDAFGLTGFTPNSKQALEIEKLSGGISFLVKICMLAMRDDTSLDPNLNLKLKGQIEEMLATNPSHPAYAKASLIQDYLGSKPGEFTAAESRLYELLKSKQGQIVSKDEIAKTVYPDVKNYNGVSDHALDQLVHRLRSKISHLGSSITTHRGLGYKLS